VFSSAKFLFKSEGGSAGAAKEVSPPLSVSPPALASTAAASDAERGAPVAPKHAGEILEELRGVEKAQQGGGGDGETSLAEDIFAAVAGAAAAAAAAGTKAAAAADDAAELLALRSRIFSQQPPTEDKTPHGAAGRAARVASLREAAVSAELDYRRRRSSSNKDTSLLLPPSPMSRSLFPPAPLSPSHRDYLAFCVVLKDQSDDLPEFVAWHAALGVRNFYLFDHGSNPPVSAREAAAMLPPTAAKDGTRVVVTPLTEADVAAHPSRIPQMAAYDSCVAAHRAEHEWLAFLDVDEFVVISPNSSFSSFSSSSASSSSSSTAADAVPSLPLLLSRYEGAAAALALHWSMFGSGGRASRKPDSTLTAEAFQACLPRDNGNNRHVKTVAATRMLDVAEPCLGAHHFAYWDFEGAVADAAAAASAAASAADASASSSSPSSPSPARRRPQPFAVDVEGARIDGPYSRVAPGDPPPRVPHAPAFLAHYVLKSKEEYEAKMLRGNAMRSSKGWAFFEEVDSLSTERCVEAAALAQKIKATMKMMTP